ncbi:MAG TPA: c-type cytochrome [Acidimicrobiia bacterium]|nr:c-type cytochrome [Acidimicrobiia bacterium]
MSFRLTLILLNVVALFVIAGVIVWRVVSLRRNQETTPANQTPFLDDEGLEGRRLERALGWSLVFVLIIAVALPVYFLLEPTRQVQMEEGFVERSVEQGAVLYAGQASPEYNAEVSLLCANCHGVEGEGGAAPFVLQPESDKCVEEENQGNEDVPECLPKQVSWEAPPLNTALLRFDREQVTEILNYGRPGTPMPAWGVISGQGILNEQSIDDLVNYLESIQISSKEATAISKEAVNEYRVSGSDLVDQVEEELETATDALTEAQADRTTTPAALAELQDAVDSAQAKLEAATAYAEEVEGLSEGAILFRLNCARCHTKGWSYFDPTNLELPPLPPQGSGAYGPNLRDGSTLLQFPGKAGKDKQFSWIALGVPANSQYGVRGISSGRMPHFARQLTDDQITKIVEYERNL